MSIPIKNITAAILLMTTALFSDSGGQGEINAQAQQMLEIVDSGLNRVYKALLEERKSDAESVEKIRQTQREWLKGMEAVISETFPLEKGQKPQELYGSNYHSEYCELRSQLILDRIKELQKLGGKTAFDLDDFYANHESMQDAPDPEPAISNSNNISLPVARSSTESSTAPMEFGGMWIIKTSNGSLVVEKYKNTGKRPIKAFRCSIESLNDFDEIKGSFETVYDTNTKFFNGQNMVVKHAIQPGDFIYIQTVRIEFETTIFALGTHPFLEKFDVRSEKDIPPGCEADEKKLRFKLEKVAYAD